MKMLIKRFKNGTTAVGGIPSPAIDETRVQMIREYLGKPFDQITMMELVCQISEMPEKMKEMFSTNFNIHCCTRTKIIISSRRTKDMELAMKATDAMAQEIQRKLLSASIEQKLDDLFVEASE